MTAPPQTSAPATQTTHWHARKADEALADLQTDAARGLAPEEAQQRRAKHGDNKLAEAPPVSRVKRFLAQFTQLVIWILIAAAIISGWMKEWTDTIVIVAIVLLNGILGYLQEQKADEALAALRRMSMPHAKALRGGALQNIAAPELVPGDRVELEAGDHIPADLRLISTVGFRVVEAALTGESNPVDKESGVVLEADTPLGERANMAYMGTTASAGKASAVVVATGMQTELGQIAGLLQRQQAEPTPLQKQLAGLGRVLVVVCLVIVGVIFIVQIARGSAIQEAFLLSISLAVAAVPEGLPAVVTIALALGLQRMARRHALIRKLPSVETLGSVTIICTDKTGTLTRNEMTVREIFAGLGEFEITGVGYTPTGDFRLRGSQSAISDPLGHSDLVQVLTIGAWANYARLEPPGTMLDEPPNESPVGRALPADLPADASSISWRLTGDPTEGALVAVALKAGILTANRDHQLLYEIPFDSDRKRMSVVGRAEGGRGTMYTKGAPEVVLSLCSFERMDGQVIPLTAERKTKILRTNSDMAGRALRVLALAYREFPDVWPHECPEADLVFAGLAGLFDPPREEVRDAVAKCHAAGIRPVMITGDHPATALAVACELGIACKTDQVLAGRKLDDLNDEQLREQVPLTAVFARVTAEHKLRIVRAWQQREQIVAMTGDGVNDAPAVKAADIGIAMGRGGTDVTREAAAMVLTDDNFATIVAAIEEGRGIFDNIRKFIQYLLGCNTGEVLFMLVGALVGWPPPLTAIQILWINLVTDALPALALGLEPPEPDIMSRCPRPTSEGVITRNRGLVMLLHGTLIAGATIAGFAMVYRNNHDLLIRAQTVAFCILSYSQLFYSFSCRSQRYTMPELGLFTNRHLLWAIVISGLLQLAVFLPFVRTVFKVEGNLGWDWALILGLSLVPVTIIEVGKLVRAGYRRRKRSAAR
ncbi:MAG TPA: cation-translocating P-type ATPase [Humisphaera sp.]|jgi:Ca2+-transporting ATPase|nr:cation-translocating P-type ATPase [Humisphaera sp.]